MISWGEQQWDSIAAVINSITSFDPRPYYNGTTIKVHKMTQTEDIKFDVYQPDDGGSIAFMTCAPVAGHWISGWHVPIVYLSEGPSFNRVLLSDNIPRGMPSLFGPDRYEEWPPYLRNKAPLCFIYQHVVADVRPIDQGVGTKIRWLVYFEDD